jgi:hypothetical protein
MNRRSEGGLPSMRIGSLEHRDAFCSHFAQTYVDYDPEALPWPVLDDAALHRLRQVPFWGDVFHAERRAGAIVAAFTETITDPVLKRALALQGQEEARHGNLIRVMIDRYGLDAPERPIGDLGRDIETSFKDFGFGECFDAFVGFGLFKIAWQSEYLPREIMQIFSMLMYEETRHIVFFINWMAYTEARKGWLARTVSPLVSLRYYVRAVHNKIRFARRGQQVNDGKNLAAIQVSMFLDGFNFRRFLEDCYAENSRRMSVFDPELLRPSFLPQLTDVALKALRPWGRRAELESRPGPLPPLYGTQPGSAATRRSGG